MNDDPDLPLRLRIVNTPELKDPMPKESIDASIPMLTEIMDFSVEPIEPFPDTEPNELSLEQKPELDINALKQDLQERILESLLEKSDHFLAREFQERVKPVLERTVASMVQDLHIHLEQVLRDAVAAAISEELNKLNLDP